MVLSMELGIPVERKKYERRIALVPEDVSKLVGDGHTVYVESGAGNGSGFADESYMLAGAEIVEQLPDLDLRVQVKRPPTIDDLTGHKYNTIMGYFYVEDDLDNQLLDMLLKSGIECYAYHEIRDSNYKRKVNLGHEAGIVGMIEALNIWGAIQEEHGKKNYFKGLKSMFEYGHTAPAYSDLETMRSDNIDVAIMGGGTVAGGVLEALKRTDIYPQVLSRNETDRIEDYLGDVDILVNAIAWKPGDKHIITKDNISLMKPTALIADIACYENGGVQTCKATKWSNPTYKSQGITHFCVDNIPSAVPRESSEHLSSMIFPYVSAVANGLSSVSDDTFYELRTGLMTQGGKIMFNSAEDRQPINDKYPFSEIESVCVW